MKVRWDRVVGTALIVVVGLFCLVRCSAIEGFFAGIRHIGSEDREEHMLGLVAFGVLMVLLVILAQITRPPRSS